MKKYQNLVRRTITLCMPVILILGLVINLVFPDRELSFVENRSLQKFPEMDRTSILDGSFETKLSSGLRISLWEEMVLFIFAMGC